MKPIGHKKDPTDDIAPMIENPLNLGAAEETQKGPVYKVFCDICKIDSNYATYPEHPEGWMIEETPSGWPVAMCRLCKDLGEENLNHLHDAMARAVQTHIDGPLRFIGCMPNTDSPRPDAEKKPPCSS